MSACWLVNIPFGDPELAATSREKAAEVKKNIYIKNRAFSRYFHPHYHRLSVWAVIFKPQYLIFLTKAPTAEDSDTVFEIPPEISRLLLRSGGLPQEDLVKIFHNRFNPINLYRLSYKQLIGKGIRKEDRLREPRKTSGSYEDFGNSVHEVWSQSFLNYTSIFIAIFGNTAPGLEASPFTKIAN